jgi:hypothetical protein
MKPIANTYFNAVSPTSRSMSVIIIFACVAMIVLVTHHPVAVGGSLVETLEIIRQSTMADQTVHGALMIVLSLLAVAMWHFSVMLGIKRPIVRAATLAYLLALVLAFFAMVNDGFAIPMIAAHCERSRDEAACLPAAQVMLSYSIIQIQAFARLTFIVMSIAFACWSVALWRYGTHAKIVAFAGFVSTVTQIALLYSVASMLTPKTLLIVLAAQVVWYLAVAALMAGWLDGCAGATLNR